jgi:hypothetical protein
MSSETKDGSSASEAARQLSALGAKKGGHARANVLTPEERSEIARRASEARWAGKAGKSARLAASKALLPSAPATEAMPFSLFDGILAIGDVSFECHVLNDHRRVLTQAAVVRLITGGRESGDLNRYFRGLPTLDRSVMDRRPIEFKIPGNPVVARGMEATTLVEICEAYLKAQDEGKLKPNQEHLAKRAAIVIRACAKVGIIALVDEATGYQAVRRKRALQLKLQAFIAEDIQEWAKTFPDEFWYELARLENTRYSPRLRPLRWGKYVMAFVYDAIDQDVGKELRRRNPNPQHGRNHHQWLQEFGKEKLHDQLERVIAVMKACDDMEQFKRVFARVFRRPGEPEQLLFDFDFE